MCQSLSKFADIFGTHKNTLVVSKNHRGYFSDAAHCTLKLLPNTEKKVHVLLIIIFTGKHENFEPHGEYFQALNRMLP
jgi:hypothetical protein